MNQLVILKFVHINKYLNTLVGVIISRRNEMYQCTSSKLSKNFGTWYAIYY